MRPTLRNLLIAINCCLAYGQTFDAASVKPAEPPRPDGRGRIFMVGPSGGPGTKDPGRIRYQFMSLKTLLVNAFDVKAFQIVGPAWLDTERFDVNATMPPQTTKAQFQVMLQNLLAERFKMQFHRETKELPVFALVVAKGGPKLQEAKDEPPPPESDGPQSLPSIPKMGPDGFPDLSKVLAGRGGIFMMMEPDRARLVGQKATLQDLAGRLSNELSKPVTDETGLTKKYDFTLTYSHEGFNGPMGMPPPPPGGGAGNPENVYKPEGAPPPDLFHAMQSQLGLRLESKKGPVEQIVIDRMEKTPIEN